MAVPDFIDNTNWEVKAPPDVPKEPFVEKPGAFIAKSGARAFGEQVGKRVEAATAFTYGESVPKAAIRFFLGSDFADKYVPDVVENIVKKLPFIPKSPVATFRDAVSPFRDDTSKDLTPETAVKQVQASPLGAENLADISGQTAINVGRAAGLDWADRPDLGQPPGYISKNLGKAASFLGTAVATPEFGAMTTPLKYAASAIGASEMGEAGRVTAEAPFKTINKFHPGTISPETIDSMGTIADVGASTVGGAANVVRLNAFGVPVNAAAKGLSHMKQAYTDAKAAQAAAEARGDKDIPSIFSLYGHQWDALKAESQSAMGEVVKRTIANDLRKDINAEGNPRWKEDAEAFDNAVKAVGDDPNKYTIAQRTGTPSLVATQSQFRPDLPEHSQQIAAQQKQVTQSVVDDAKRIAGRAGVTDPNKRPDLVRDVNEAQKMYNLRVAGLNQEAQNVADTTPRLAASERDALGARAREIAQAELDQATRDKNMLYADRDNEADRLGVRINLNPLVNTATKILGKPLTEVAPETAPKSIARLKELAVREELRVSMKDVGELLTQFNDDAHNAYVSAKRTGDVAQANAARNLDEIAKSIEKDIIGGKDVPDVVKTLHNTAVNWFRENFAPRFREGTAASLFTDTASGANRGQPTIDNMAIFAPNAKGFLEKPPGTGTISETSMKNFDALYKNNPEAKEILWKNIEHEYNADVLNDGAKTFDVKKHAAFMREYEAAIDRVPALRQKLNDNANAILDKQAEASRVEKQFETITGSPFGTKFDQKTVENMFNAALEDPRKMGQLIKLYRDLDGTPQQLIKELMYRAMPYKETANGVVLDAAKLNKLLDKGKSVEGGIGSLQMLARSVFGRAEGDAHIGNLRALALIADRVESTTPRFMRPQEPLGAAPTPKAVSGSTGASLLSDLKSFLQGRQSAVYLGAITGGRFFNKRVTEALDQATVEALFDPKKSGAIYDLASKPAGSLIPMGKLQTLVSSAGEDGKNFISSLIDHGHIKKHMLNAGRLAVQYDVDEKMDQEKKKGSVVKDSRTSKEYDTEPRRQDPPATRTGLRIVTQDKDNQTLVVDDAGHAVPAFTTTAQVRHLVKTGRLDAKTGTLILKEGFGLNETLSDPPNVARGTIKRPFHAR